MHSCVSAILVIVNDWSEQLRGGDHVENLGLADSRVCVYD